MSKEIENEDGTKEIVYTQAEIDEINAGNKKHLEEKLAEFEQGKKSGQLKEEEMKTQMAEQAKKVEEALNLATKIQTDSRTKVIDMVVDNLVGQDAGLRTKIMEEFKIVEAGYQAQGRDIFDDKTIIEMLTKSSGMAGINAPANPNFGMNGGMAPSFVRKESELSDQEHETFMKAVGYETPKPKQES